MKEFKQRLSHYYRLTKPGIIYGNVMTAGAGYLLGSRWEVGISSLVGVIVGTSLVIACGCVLNNYIDRGIDAKMARTQKRELVTGTVGLKQALVFASTLGAIGFFFLVMLTNLLVVSIGLTALLMYVVVYGIIKRRSTYGTLVGTIPGSAAMVAGYCAATGRFDLGALIVLLIMTFWQMPHFYTIAIYRIDDYKAAGIPVLPLVRGIRETKKQIIIYASLFLVAALALSAFGYTGYLYGLAMALIGGQWIRKGVQGLTSPGLNDIKWAKGMFGFSLVVLLFLSIAMPLGAILP